MRASSTALVVLCAAISLVGCSDPISPTRPTSVMQPAGGALAAAPSGASQTAPPEVPFEGALQGVDVDSDPTPTSIVVTTDGTGTATHLGRFSFSQRVTVSFATLTSVGASRWVAANGDSFDTMIAGSGHPTEIPGEFSITDIHTVTGGTGRFAGAQGRFVVERVASGITFLTSGSFEGTLTTRRIAD